MEHKDYSMKTIENKDLIMYKGKIYIPDSLKNRLMDWYHTHLVHPGSTRMLHSIQATMHWHGIRKDVEKYVRTAMYVNVARKTRKNMDIYLQRKQRQLHGKELMLISLVLTP